MDFEPSDEQQMLIDQVRRYVREEILPLEAKLDPDASELPPEDLATALASAFAFASVVVEELTVSRSPA